MGSGSFEHLKIQMIKKLEIKNPAIWSKAIVTEDKENAITRNYKKVANSEKGIKQRSRNFELNLRVYIKASYWASGCDRYYFTEEKNGRWWKKKTLKGLLIDFWK